MAESPQTPGESLRMEERGMGKAMKMIIDHYYAAHDLDTAQAIRRASTDTEASAMVGQLRRGRWQEVLMLAASGAAGVATGMIAQKTLDVRVGPVPPLAAAGVIAVIAAAAADVSLVARATIAVGGAAYAASTFAYTRLVPGQGGGA
ncbi:hypothetical protein [Nannocystis bainbridge]|uniref:Uncharacterized protein n=1 Tax=Nannocystis bainbridge TaxID=2995303 RepID=A0ABT5DUV2_9BACT|nr:hypothetical protein [Nannocystis bainbridge]MDC0716207.1 hypothetical protein [Nannocystis bainbridge]